MSHKAASNPFSEALALKLGAAMADVIAAAVAQATAELETTTGAEAARSAPGRPPKALEPLPDQGRVAYTIKEAAEATGVSVSGIWRRVADGELTTFKWAGRTLIRADVLLAAVDRASGRGGGGARG